MFCQFEAPEYAPEGVAEFRRTLADVDGMRRMYLYGAFAGDTLVGMLAMRGTRHISLFFVKADWHRKGVGRRLFDAMVRDWGPQEFTVHSSPYAVEIYRRLGFVPTDTEQVTNGIRYTPMRFRP
ncbi:MAG: GNAT family N-acetyltransferase [Candidatus Onthomonas sp.]|nr:GNAT family N-acetyltransferase [Candidatus Onthomonas sp.]